MPRRIASDEFKNYIDNFLEPAKVISTILNPIPLKNRKIVEGEVNAFQQFQKIVKGLCDMLKSEEDRLYKSEDYINKLRYIAKHTHYQNSASVNEETVKIFSLSDLTSLAYNNDLRSLEFDTVFLGDFVEGRFQKIIVQIRYYQKTLIAMKKNNYTIIDPYSIEFSSLFASDSTSLYHNVNANRS